MDLNRLSPGDRVIGASGALLFVFSFVDWLGVEITGGPALFGEPARYSFGKSAWSFPITMVAVVLGLAMVALVVVKAFGAELPRPGRLTWGQVLLALGVAVFLLIAMKLAVGPKEWVFNENAKGQIDEIDRFCRASIPNCGSFETTRGVGVIVGLLAGAGLALGGYLRNQEDTSPAPASRSRATTSA